MWEACRPSRGQRRGRFVPVSSSHASLLLASFPTWVPSSPPRCPIPSSSLLSTSSRRHPLESGVGTWHCRCRGWSWSWLCRGCGRYRGGVGRRGGGGQHGGGVDVVVVDLAWSAWGMVVDVVVIDVARSTRRGCGRVVDVAWSWLRSTRHVRWWRSSSSAQHARRSWPPTEVVVVVVVDTTWGGCRRRRRDVGGVGSMSMSLTWSSSSRRGGRRRDVGGVVDVGVVDVA